MGAFELLHVSVREAIWRQAWKELRPLQVQAIHAVLESQDHLILSAATASGKTEAAFLPIISKLAESTAPGIRAMYVSPLKALINDQFRRLESLCEMAQIPVHRWHGDVSGNDKAKIRKSPEGILLITPESLESQCINYGWHLPRLYPQLEFVVIDELHAFLEDVRGIHLRSLLSRICLASGSSPRFFGLSATLGDFSPAQRFLAGTSGRQVRVLQDAAGESELRVGLKHFMRPPKAAQEETDELTAERSVAADISNRFRDATNLIFFNSRGLTEEIADLVNERATFEAWPSNPFRVHHGSLSKELRETTEAELKSSQPITALCTRTLEMGIDIGAVQCVGQVGAPWTVSSLVQRVGRSGRREGEAKTLRFYAIDPAVTESSTLTERLHPELLRSIAMVELMLGRWIESPKTDRKHYSTFIHQVLSVLRQTGGTRADALYSVLCGKGAFSQITKAEYAATLRNLARHSIIQQMETGEMILAPEGERIVEARDFYAAFASCEEYSVEHNADKIGVMPRDQLPPVGEHLLLAGKRWCITDIDHRAKRAEVLPARGKRVPLFLGQAGALAREVMDKMRHVLCSTQVPPYLHTGAVKALDAARQTYAKVAPRSGPACFESNGAVCLLPWSGTSVHRTLIACARADGMVASTSTDGLLISYNIGLSDALKKHWRRIAKGEFTHSCLTSHITDPAMERFDELVPPELLALAYVHEVLDLQEAAKLANCLCDS